MPMGPRVRPIQLRVTRKAISWKPMVTRARKMPDSLSVGTASAAPKRAATSPAMGRVNQKPAPRRVARMAAV